MKLSIICLELILVTLLFFDSKGQEIRPVRDNIGFCWTAGEMDCIIKYLTKDYNDKEFEPGNLVAAISPHDDYLYAGRVYFSLYKYLRTKEVVIIGVTHSTVRKEMNNPKNILIFDEYDYWKGPYGNVEISPLRNYIKNRLSENNFISSNKAQNIEHSIEALIPFLQYYNRDIKITPIMVTEMSFGTMEEISDELSSILAEYIKQNRMELGKDILFLISTDANHYGEDFGNFPFGQDEKAHKNATETDKNIADSFLAGVIDETKIRKLTENLWPDSSSNSIIPLWCGRYPIPFGLLTTINVTHKINNALISGEILKYSDTWTEKVLPINNTSLGLTAPFSLKHWVGFLSVGYRLSN